MTTGVDPGRSDDGRGVALGPDDWGPDGRPDPLIRRKHGLIGASVLRVDGAPKVRGEARFAAEVPLPGLTYAALAYSTVAKGRLMSLSTDDAEAAPGVVLVMTHRNAPRMRAPSQIGTSEKAFAADGRPVMQDDRVRWNGQPIALVLAETPQQAEHAAALIGATYEEEEASVDFDAARAGSRVADPFEGQSLSEEDGDAEAALAASAFSIDVSYSTPRQSHNALEPHAATVVWSGDELTVHDGTQALASMAWAMAEVFDVDESRVHVSSPYVGGGFGGKTLWQHQILAAAAAKLAGRPVRLALGRKEVYRVVGARAATRQRVAIGAGADGRFAALLHTGVSATSRYSNMPEPFVMAARLLYASETRKTEVRVVDMDILANGYVRAPGEAVGTYALECAVDELADRIGIDPIELRLLNEPDVDPSSGQPFSLRGLVEAYRMGAARFGWDRRTAPGSRRDGEWLVGVGCATATYPYLRFPGGDARITLTRDGHATVEVAAHELGMGTATVQTQICAERLGLPLERVAFVHGASSLPGFILAGASQQTAAIAGAVIAAHRQLVAELLELAGDDSPLAGLLPDEIGTVEGGLCRLDDPAVRQSYGSILARAGRMEVTAQAAAPMPLEWMHWSMHSYGAQFCEVRVNAVTGETRVSRFLGSFDCGRILNPNTAASQFRGGIIMGLGLALMEETVLDARSGRTINASLAENHVPVHADVPEIDIVWTDVPDEKAPLGAHGVGEIGITGTAAAVANAVYNATGVRVRDLPLTPDKLLGSGALPD